MTAANQTKILDKKIMRNEAQYDLKEKLVKYLHYLLITSAKVNI